MYVCVCVCVCVCIRREQLVQGLQSDLRAAPKQDLINRSAHCVQFDYEPRPPCFVLLLTSTMCVCIYIGNPSFLLFPPSPLPPSFSYFILTPFPATLFSFFTSLQAGVRPQGGEDRTTDQNRGEEKVSE